MAVVTGLIYQDRTTEELHTIELEGIFVQIGLLPNTEWLGYGCVVQARRN